MLFQRIALKLKRYKKIDLKSNRKAKIGILIVNGEIGPLGGSWISMCLKNVYKYTHYSNYTVYLWNNNVATNLFNQIAKKYPSIKQLNAKPGEKLKHPHAEPLQKLYKKALMDKVEYIVTLDSDAFPIHNNWLQLLIEKLDNKTVLAGVWRDELKTAIQPYIHPSCLCVSVDFIKKFDLRFDDRYVSTEIKKDTASCFTRAALEHNYKLFKLERSNKNQFHYIMGGIYGGMIYHHGAGSRKNISFWGEKKTDDILLKNKIINLGLKQILFNYERLYINWLSGNSIDNIAPKNVRDEFNVEIEKLKQSIAEIALK
jgi:hypothetical protein